MNSDEFQKNSLKSVALSSDDPHALAHRALGITGEAGILANRIKKIIRDKNGTADKEDLQAIERLLGDVLYYSAVLADYFGMSLSEVMQNNINRSSQFAKDRKNLDEVFKK